jgi:hypothetical protein
MPTSTSGVVYEYVSTSEDDRTPTESAPPDGSFRGEVILQCDWADRDTLLTDIAAGSGELYPYLPATGARAYAAGIRGAGATTVDPTTGLFSHDKAEIRVAYITKDGMLTTISLLFIEQLHSVGQGFSIPTDELHWGSASGTELVSGESPHVGQTMLEYIRTYPKVGIEDSRSYGLIDTVNANVFPCLTLNHVFPIGTLRYIGPVVERRLELGTLSKIAISHHFLGRKWDWNKWYRTENNTFEDVYHSSGSGRLEFYPPANHQLMFLHSA